MERGRADDSAEAPAHKHLAPPIESRPKLSTPAAWMGRTTLGHFNTQGSFLTGFRSGNMSFDFGAGGEERDFVESGGGVRHV